MLKQQAPVFSIARKAPRRTSESSAPLSQYEEDCLAGRRFPEPGDTRMEQRCREAYRIREWIELFRRFHMPTLSRETHYKSAFKIYFPPLLDVKPGELSRQAVTQWLTQMGEKSHVQANHNFTLLRTLYHKARDWGIYSGPNPTDGVKRFRLQSRTRFIQPEEMPRILLALQDEADCTQSIFLLCLLVACRPGEATHMKWADLRFTNELVREQQPDGTYVERQELRGVWTKPTTKTGVPQTVPLPPQLALRLHRMPRLSEWVFPGTECHPRRRRPGPMSHTIIHKHWTRIRERAGISDLRPYDLRRTAASWLAINGENAVMIAKVLNHASLQHTHIYTRLNVAPVMKTLNAHEEQVLSYAPTRIVQTDALAPVPLPSEGQPDDRPVSPVIEAVPKPDQMGSPGLDADPVEEGGQEWPG